MSSAKQTERARLPERERADAGAGKADSTAAAWLVLLVPLCAGWVYILRIQHWHFGASTFFLFTGWLAVLLTTGFLLEAGLAATRGAARADDEEFWRPEGRREELLREKKALLKALKEIEFDQQMGKMSAEDAASIGGFYRARAIQIMKVLDGQEEEPPFDTPAARAAQGERDGEEPSFDSPLRHAPSTRPLRGLLRTNGTSAGGSGRTEPPRAAQDERASVDERIEADIAARLGKEEGQS
jgi:hypothetical protein